MSRLVSAQRVATLVGDFPRSPAYLGLAESLRVLIGDGRIGIEVRLPSERDLTTSLDVSRTTVTRAYEVLRESGYAEARRGSGTFTTVPGGQRRSIVNGMLSIYLDPSHFGAAGFAETARQYAEYVRASRPADPARPVLVPGDAEHATRTARLRDGVPLQAETWTAIRDTCAALGVA